MNLIWCPSIDDEMDEQMNSFIKNFPMTHHAKLEGGKKQLGGFNAAVDRLYILAHGHRRMPVFTCNDKRWTADQLVAMLKSDRLPLDWREIELLVCNAGESVNSAAVGNELWRIRKKADIPVFGGLVKGLVKKKFEEKAKLSDEPSPYDSTDQLLPLAAQFAHALKTARYTNFRITSYAAPVAQYFSIGKVTLDMKTKKGTFGESLDKHPDLIKIWR